MGKSKKHAKAHKGGPKKGSKPDNRKRKAKHTDPMSNVSKDVRATAEAIAEQIERGDFEEEVGTAKPRALDKETKRLKEIAMQVGIKVNKGTTKQQAYKMVSRLQNDTTARIDGKPNGDDKSGNDMGDGDSEDGGDGSEEDYSDTANERAKEYRKGGYHPVVISEIYHNRYRIVKKLGWGYFSTVWLVWDYKEERYQAMKIQKSAKHYTEAAFDEIRLLSEIMQADKFKTRCCARLNDYFKHTGPNGTHVCMVFDVYGENLLSLMERYEYRGIPLPIVKCITRQILIALEHIASIDIIHTDLKPENVLLSTPKHSIISLMRHYHPPPLHQGVRLTERVPSTMTKSQRRRYYRKLAKKKMAQTKGAEEDSPQEANKPSSHSDGSHEDNDSASSKTDSEWEVERFHHVILADFGNSCWTYKHFTDEVQTRQYRSPEVILGEPYSTPIDMWSCACMIFELITGEFLFDPKKGDDYPRDEDHLALMSELLGELPESMRLGSGKYRGYFYNSGGHLRNIKDLHFWGLEDVLHRKHHFTKKKAKEIANFLTPMMEYIPEDRATAADMLTKYDSFFHIQEDDYEPLCFVSSHSHKGESTPVDDEDGMEEGSSHSTSASTSTRSSDDGTSDDSSSSEGNTPSMHLWERHPLLNSGTLEERGLSLADIQAVINGKFLDDPTLQEAANEVVRLLSEEVVTAPPEELSDGHDADWEDAGESTDGAAGASDDGKSSPTKHAVQPKSGDSVE